MECLGGVQEVEEVVEAVEAVEVVDPEVEEEVMNLVLHTREIHCLTPCPILHG